MTFITGGAAAGMNGPALDQTATGAVGAAMEPPPGAVPGQVCFFDGAYFAGEGFCLPPGAYSLALLGGWDNRISSIWVDPATLVQICRDENLGGACELVTMSVPQLFGTWQDGLTSFTVLPAAEVVAATN
jgi:hypothetical protein